MAKKSKITNKIIIFWIGIFIGAFVVIKFPFKAKSDVELAKEKLEEFYRMEEICGKGNVSDKCNYNYCSAELGLTCFVWHKAAREAEKKAGD